MTGEPTEPRTERLFRGTGEHYPDDVALPEPPPWRRPRPDGTARAERPYLIGPEQVEVVNAALRLRRPLLVTGNPGTGKSSLAYAVADELGLGPVLVWPVNTRSTLTDALYRYDAIGRLRGEAPAPGADHEPNASAGVGSYVRLGPLGTALATRHEGRPRLLLIDELDKSDVDLPNDLLHVLEEGEFTIPELARLPESPDGVAVFTEGSQERVTVHRGTVRCADFPFVVITSNGEREFPPAFLRRCVRLELPDPGRQQLQDIVRAHFAEAGPDVLAEHWPKVCELIESFVVRRDLGGLATDQLLHAVHLLRQGVQPDARHLREAVLRELRDGGGR
ncbi:AAA family ATPase [Actinacidiphila epipremni]|uniref:AAA family ATPase n=1 Tax=Actinacidiphila epipremni TaxID=2053013 RepID=A0ABX1A1T8_9ACTN|nr:MoxR family ATPase [Actinacidiphila epipremni]NJP47746.1 AAA family ATPase [Actinacidiphila epipremni]